MRWEPLNLAAPEYAERPQPPDIAGLIYTGARHVISGPPESTKTLFSLVIALEHMRASGTIAHVDLEMGASATRALLEDLGATLEEIASIYYVTPDYPPEADDIDAMTTCGVTLAVIDAAAGAYDISELDDNKRRDAETFARAWIRPLWERGVTTLLLDHVVKNSDGRGKFAIGSERKVGQADAHLGLEVVKQLHRGAEGLVRIRTHKDRRGFLPRPTAAELHLRSDPDTHRISWEWQASSGDTAGNGWKPTFLMQRVADFVSQHGDVSRNQIEKNVKGKASYLREAIDLLVLDGYLEERHGERGARALSVLKPYLVPVRPYLVPDEDEVPRPSSLPLQRDEDEDEVASADEVERLASRAKGGRVVAQARRSASTSTPSSAKKTQRRNAADD